MATGVRATRPSATKRGLATVDRRTPESFWGRLRKASVHGHRFATREEASRSVMDWIAFYNHRRLHSSLGYISPMRYEQRWYKAQRKNAA